MKKMIKKIQHYSIINNTSNISFNTSIKGIINNKKKKESSIKTMILKKAQQEQERFPLYMPKPSNILQYSYIMTESPIKTDNRNHYIKLPKIPSPSSSQPMKYKLSNNSSLSSKINSINLSNIHKLYNKPSSRNKQSYFNEGIICAGKSSAGMKANKKRKINQDSYMIINSSTDLNPIFGIFDGHGINGHLVSQFIKDYFIEYFELFSSPSKNSFIYRDAIMHTYKSCEELLFRQTKFNTNDSGSTAVMIIQLRQTILCFNTGDSRAVYINDTNEVYPITDDHKPNNKIEAKRIREAGGTIELDGYGENGTYRIYEGDSNGPGLALSRSFGDFNAKCVGIISTPDVYELSITNERIKVIVLGSDGLWDSMSNERVRDLIEPFIENKKAIEACNVLLAEAKRGWASEGVYCDDITVIVIFI